MTGGGLTHFDASGNAHMVDVSAKPVTDRIAVARGSVIMQAETLALISEGLISPLPVDDITTP